MEQIATDTYSFDKLRNGGFVYVDKTAILEKLANGKIGSQFFIARPRRFGKSLAVSTLQCLFEGRRDLFKGLAIEDKWDWSKTYPVLHLDMGSCQAADVEGLWRKILDMLRSEAKRLDIELHGETISGMFAHAIEDLAARNREEQMRAVDAMVSIASDKGGQIPSDAFGTNASTGQMHPPVKGRRDVLRTGRVRGAHEEGHREDSLETRSP